jgi:hypothetical protein
LSALWESKPQLDFVGGGDFKQESCRESREPGCLFLFFFGGI